MSSPKNNQISRFSNAIAYASWLPTLQEKRVLSARDFMDKINCVDQIWEYLVKYYPEILAVDAPHACHQEKFTYREFAELIKILSNALTKLDLKKGEVVALFGENSPRWLAVDQAIMRAGAADAVRGASAPVEELNYILQDSKAVGLIVQNSEVWEKLSLSREYIKALKFIIQLEGIPAKEVTSWSSLLEIGRSIKYLSSSSSQNNIEDESRNIATIIYTSGTTGRPKGVPLTHLNFLHQMKALACVANPPPGSPVLSVLPIWHAYERSAEYYFFSCACSQTYTTIKYLKEDLPRVRPVVMATVPRLWEAIQTGFEDVIGKMPTFRRVLLKAALANSGSYKSSLRKM